MPRIVIQGWRFLPHSFSLVNEFQCLELLRRPEISLYHQDIPYFYAKWQAARGVLDAKSEDLVAGLPPPPENLAADATYRIAFPFDLRPSGSPRTAVFATAECMVVPHGHLIGGSTLPDALARSDAVVVTPSNWSRQGFVASGADPRRVVVVPHGVDPVIFHPISADERAALRRKAQWEDHFVFLHVGNMTRNKNMPTLLRAFAAVAERHRHARLALKGLDALYQSRLRLEETMRSLTSAQIALIQPRLNFWSGTFSMASMAELYQTADAYVSPYSAEAFNLPVLEAAACGLPVICTRGGSTDDFTTPEFALHVQSTPALLPRPGQAGKILSVSEEDLVRQMTRIVEDRVFSASAATTAPRFVSERFTWKIAVDRLLGVLLPTGN